ncbi:MAG: DUF1048 domain-containing protein [Patescibacteria group bacterium]|jgi:DNA-binding ferritin-like protein (Dps family)
MNNFLEKIIGGIEAKKEWRATEARAKALPREYRIVYEEMKHYFFNNTGLYTIDVFKNIVDLFEESAANGKPVLEITGNDVAAFCDELVRGEKTYVENGREKLNQNIEKKLGK